MAGADSALLDFSRPLDVPLLDATVNLFYTSTNNEEVRCWRRLEPLTRPGGQTAVSVAAIQCQQAQAEHLERAHEHSARSHSLSRAHSRSPCPPGLTRPPAVAAAQRAAAERVMRALQEHPEMYTRVDAILETSTSPNSKFFALQVSPTTRG